METGILLCTPAQVYLNRSFKADALSFKCVGEVMGKPVDCKAEPQAALDGIEKAIRANFHIVSGDAGRALASDYLELLRDFDAQLWQEPFPTGTQGGPRGPKGALGCPRGP